MKEKLSWELIKKFIKTKLGMVTIAASTAAVIGGGVIIAVNMQEEAYRSISAFEVNGTSTLLRDSESFDVYEGMMIRSGDEIDVFTDGYLRLLLDDDKYITLEPDTTILLNAFGNSVDSKTSIMLTKGAITNEIQNKLTSNSSYEVTTPISTMAVRGTTYYISLKTDETGQYEVDLVVLGGSVATTLIMPDGTTSSDEVLVNAGTQAQIVNDTSSTHFVYTDEPINYDELPTDVLEHIIQLKENGALPDLSTTKEELKLLVETRANPPADAVDQLAPEELPILEEPEKEPEETPKESPITKKPAAPKVKTEKPIAPPVVETPPAPPAAPPAPSDPGAEVPSAPDPLPPTVPPAPTTYTVTFMSGAPGTATTFATQTVTIGGYAKAPILSPDSDPKWFLSTGTEFNFGVDVINQNMSLYSTQ